MKLQENKCAQLAPEDLYELPKGDALQTIYDLQVKLQERLGMMDKYQNADMVEKTNQIKENIIHINCELVELLERLPFKYWKTYSDDMKAGWTNEEQKNETLFEFIDAMHFFMNIAIILGFKPEEIFHYYVAKHKENVDRQDRGY